MPPWEVEVTDEFTAWWDGLTEAEQEAVTAHVGVLEEIGPALHFPRTSQIKGSRHGRMCELRIKCQGRQLRVAVRVRSASSGGSADWWRQDRQ